MFHVSDEGRCRDEIVHTGTGEGSAGFDGVWIWLLSAWWLLVWMRDVLRATETDVCEKRIVLEGVVEGVPFGSARLSEIPRITNEM